MGDTYTYITEEELIHFAETDPTIREAIWGKGTVADKASPPASSSNSDNELPTVQEKVKQLPSLDTTAELLGVAGRCNLARCTAEPSLFSVVFRPSTEATPTFTVNDFPDIYKLELLTAHEETNPLGTVIADLASVKAIMEAKQLSQPPPAEHRTKLTAALVNELNARCDEQLKEYKSLYDLITTNSALKNQVQAVPDHVLLIPETIKKAKLEIRQITNQDSKDNDNDNENKAKATIGSNPMVPLKSDSKYHWIEELISLGDKISSWANSTDKMPREEKFKKVETIELAIKSFESEYNSSLHMTPSPFAIKILLEAIKKEKATTAEWKLQLNHLASPAKLANRSLVKASIKGSFPPEPKRPNGLRTSEWYGKAPAPSECLLPCEIYSQYAFEKLFSKPNPNPRTEDNKRPDAIDLPRGLIVFAGRTSGGKSEFAMSLMCRILDNSWKQGKFQHLITFEDPIEKRFFQPKPEEPIKPKAADYLREKALEYGLHYTPRTLGPDNDCPNLEAGFADALRQNPSLVFVGETRKKEDWSEIMRFADTGHLVVTTTHAGSVTDTLQKILAAVDAKSPEDIARHARNIFAIIHVESIKTDSNNNVILPDIWRNNPQAIASLLGDGLASIIPCNPSADETESAFCFGRRHFAQWLSAAAKLKSFISVTKEENEGILTHCLQSDLRIQ